MASSNVMSVKRVEELAAEFLNEYKGNIDVLPIIKDKQEEIYGQENSVENSGIKIAGAYHPSKRIVTLVASNLDNDEDVRTTLRHELLGHYGLNTLETEDKLGLLLHVRSSENEDSLKEIWEKVNALYPTKNGLEKAEEVFAHVAEQQETLLVDNNTPRFSTATDEVITKAHLIIEAKIISDEIKAGVRSLKVFPATDYDQFKMKDKNMKNDKKPFHETVAEKIIEQLEQGTAPWQKPWKAGGDDAFLPYNPTTGNRYKGINALHLMAQGKEDQRWLTYKQASSMDAQVRKGEKSTAIQFWKFTEEKTKRDEKTGKPVLDAKGNKVKEIVKLERPRVFYAHVFNASQIDNMPEQIKQDKTEQQWTPIERAEKILAASGAKIMHTQNDNAFYRPASDEIHMPRKELFDTADKYYATALHELGHWTGHETRLDRPLNNPFGSEGYAKEELRAEISSMLLGEEIQIGHDPEQHTAYVGSWIKALKEDPLEIFRAAADAEKITGFVLSLEQKQIIDKQAELDEVDINAELREKLISEAGESLIREGEDYNPLATYLNLLKTADSLGFDTALKRSGDNSQFDKVDLTYSKNGVEYPVITEISIGDGKALTSVDSTRVSGTAFTDSKDWQSEALIDGLSLAEKNIIEADATSYESLGLKVLDSTVKASDNLDSVYFTLSNMEAVLSKYEMTEDMPAKDALAMAKLSTAIEKIGEVIQERQESKREERILTDEQIKVSLSKEQYSAWEYIKETALMKAAVPTLQNIDADKASVTFAPKNLFEGLTSEIDLTDQRASVRSVLDNEQQDNLEAALNNALLRVRVQKLEEDKPNTTNEFVSAQEPASQEFTQSSEIKYIDVPYKEKNEAKELGAKWSKEEKSWYIPPNVPAEQFSKWEKETSSTLPAEEKRPSDNQVKEDKLYLAVPFSEKEIAKSAGAKWDKSAKSWFADESSDMSVLQKYTLNSEVAHDPALSPQEEFKDVLLSMKAVVINEHPVMDGSKQRIQVEGDKPNEKSGFYVAFSDGMPNGFFTNNRTGESTKWKSKGYSLSDEERAHLQATAATKLAEREAVKVETQTRISNELSEFFNASPAASAHGHEYLNTKQIKGNEAKIATVATLESLGNSNVKVATSINEAQELRADKNHIVFMQGDLLIPARDEDDKLWSIQSIQDNGFKGFSSGAKKEGNYCITSEQKSLSDVDAIIISEGYATSKTVSNVVNNSVGTVAAFDSNNLKVVAEKLAKKYPDKPIIIAGDDDRKSELKPPHFINTGKVKGNEAATAVKGLAVFPVFAHGEAENGLSDFNDLAVKSKLGKDALTRQINSAVIKALEATKQSKVAQQQSEQKLEQKREQATYLTPPKRKVASR